jgi:hypothetical protein
MSECQPSYETVHRSLLVDAFRLPLNTEIIYWFSKQAGASALKYLHDKDNSERLQQCRNLYSPFKIDEKKQIIIKSSFVLCFLHARERS